jgi:hypothetical protein
MGYFKLLSVNIESAGKGSVVRTVPLLVITALEVVVVPFAFEDPNTADALQNAPAVYLYAKFCA